METVDKLNYLDSLVTSNCTMDVEINQRIRNGDNVVFRLESRVFDYNDPKNPTKIAVDRAVVLSTLLNSSECWTV